MKHFNRALAASLFLMTSCGDDPPSHSRGIEDIEQARNDADKSIFTNEREAQRHETAFVRLWDAMRTGDPFAALLTFPFDLFPILSASLPIVVSVSESVVLGDIHPLASLFLSLLFYNVWNVIPTICLFNFCSETF